MAARGTCRAGANCAVCADGNQAFPARLRLSWRGAPAIGAGTSRTGFAPGGPYLLPSVSGEMVERATQRQPIRVSYEATNGARETTTATDLSLGGLFVETTKKSPAIGAFVALEIESGSTKVAIDGRVLSSSPTGFAVRFIDLPNDVASALHFILATRMPRRGTTLGLGEAEEGVAKYESARSLPTAPASEPPAAAPAPAAAAPAAQPPAPAEPAPPRNPTPRMVPAAPPVVPPAPTSSAPSVVPIGQPPRPSAPPPFASPPRPSHPPAPPPAPFEAMEAPSRSRAPIVIAIVAVVVVIAIALVVALAR